MRKQLLWMAVVIIAFTSCQEEKDFNGGTVSKDGITFVFQGGASTRSADMAAPVTNGAVLPIETKDGIDLLLEETVTDLNALNPATKGTPVYTENLGNIFKNQVSVRTTKYTGDVTYEQIGNAMSSDGYWQYYHLYPTDIWDGDNAVDFWFRMPVSMPSGFTPNYKEGAITTFEYTSPSTAVDTKDIVFGGLTINQADYKKAHAKDGGAKVTLYHALTGVKFAVANDEGELDDLQINKISFIGFVNKGTCTFDPTKEEVKDKISWDKVSATKDTVAIQTFDPSDSFISYNKDNNPNHFAESFFDGGANQNVNDAAATKTFWLVPQATNANTKLLIEYTFNDSKESIEVTLGDLKASNWQAGQLRTYTFKINQVNVKVRDEVTIAGTLSNGYTGSVKKNVVITNTGNTDAYIRAALVGQWLDEEENPVFGFTDAVYELRPVSSWYEDQFITKTGASNPAREQGEFAGLIGYDLTSSNYWVKGMDGYYYFKHVVPAEDGTIPGAYKTVSEGQATDVTGPSAPLFSTYTIKKAPNAAIAGLGKTIHFELEVATQAVSAKKLDGTYLTWQEAWVKALGYDPTITDPTAN